MKRESTAELLAELIVQFNAKGWSAATGTNYSFRIGSNEDTYWVSQSGKDKAYFEADDFMKVALTGQVCTEFEHLKPSAENLIHALIYQNSDAKVILHSHSANATILPQYFLDKSENFLVIEGYELQKAIAGITSHEEQLFLPLFSNTQNIPELTAQLHNRWENCNKANGFAIGNHGIYTWGVDLAAAKRHLEAYEFLLDCVYKRMLLNK